MQPANSCAFSSRMCSLTLSTRGSVSGMGATISLQSAEPSQAVRPITFAIHAGPAALSGVQLPGERGPAVAADVGHEIDEVHDDRPAGEEQVQAMMSGEVPKGGGLR